MSKTISRTKSFHARRTYAFPRPCHVVSQTLRAALIFSLLCFFTLRVWASGEVHFLALPGPGSGVVFIDEQSQSAHITDGGAGKGILASKMGFVDVLDDLLQRGIETLVITGSHPHKDHYSGLRAIVRDDRIRSFERLIFVDNGYEMRTGRQSLFSMYRERYKDLPRELGKATYVRPEQVHLKHEFTSVALHVNAEGVTEHDRAIVSSYVIDDGMNQNRIVDFDDVSEKSALRIVERYDLDPTTIVVPHHGSSHSWSRELVAELSSVRNVVIFVNDYNQYFHPAAGVLSDVIQRYGSDRVFITRSSLGSNIVATADDIRSVGMSSEERLKGFINLRLDIISGMVETVYDAYGTLDRAPATEGSMIQALVDSGAWTERQAKRYRKALTDRPILSDLLDIVQADSYVRPPSLRRRSILSSRSAPGVRDGTKEHFAAQTGLRKYAARVGQLNWQGRALFDAEIAKDVPFFGGIVLGNSTKTPSPKTLRFVAVASADDVAISIRVELSDGRLAEYANFTPGELWSAYNFVQPTTSFRSKFPGSIPHSAGLVGIYAATMKGWRFSVHPAIANTVLATPAMRLDMLFSALDQTESWPDYLTSLDADAEWIPDFDSYQWFDDSAVFEAEGPRLVVRAKTPPHDCLMRLRFFGAEPSPEWAERSVEIVDSLCDRYRPLN